MTFYWHVDPVIAAWGSLTLRWYGLFFASGFLVGLKITQWIYRREGRPVEELDRLLLYVMAGTLIGARLVHCFFYDPEYFLHHLFEVLLVWRGGLASHGGAIGLLLAVYLFCRRPGAPGYLWLLDRIAIPATLAGAFIRIGNFFNSEILGVPTHAAWGVVFENFDRVPRHPAQLYEAAAYLIIFAVLLQLYRRKQKSSDGLRAAELQRDGLLTGVYLVLIFSARFLLEFVKMPQASYESGNTISVGQWLSVPFVLTGIFLVWYSRRAKQLTMQLS